jgi:tRNA A-37 threonylcarbamoyl transferase component Bud32
MDSRYEPYCLADPLFYDHPGAREDAADAFEHVRRPVPDGWSASAAGGRRLLRPCGEPRGPEQGWKIHVAATPESAVSVLDALWDHCVPARLPFAFLRSPALLFLRNSVYAGRDCAGKFATVYPADDAELERTLKQLDDVLAGRPGPAILSGLQYGSGPLHVRYGGFTARYCRDASGASVPAIADPRGRLVPDRAGPVFAPPRWVRLPDFLVPHLEVRRADRFAAMPYTIDRALRFSNGGGVYQGTDARTGRTVVLKQARRYAGLAGDGLDAVARLERERDVLRAAAGSGVVPEVLDWFEAGEDRFLVLEFVEGRTLDAVLDERYPLPGDGGGSSSSDGGSSDGGSEWDAGAVRAYTAWAFGVQGNVERAVAALHERGVVLGGLRLSSIMVRPDDSVALIGFGFGFGGRAATGTEAGPGGSLFAAGGFPAPDGVSGRAVDGYGLACLRLALFLPLTDLLPLDRSRARALAQVIRGQFPDVPGRFLDAAVQRIVTAGQGALPVRGLDAPIADADWPAVRDSICGSIAAMASPERADRLFPGDVRQFARPGAGLGLAHGAAGVLYALHATGAPVADEHVDWLVRRACDTPPSEVRLGFYDGVHGIAYVLDLLGYRSAALRLVDVALEEGWQRLGPDLSGGLSGIGLNLLHLAARSGDRGLYAAAVEAGRLAAEVLAQQDVARTRGGSGTRFAGAQARAGLMRGASGPALLFLHLYEHTGHPDWLQRAHAALRMDLACCTTADPGAEAGDRPAAGLADGGPGIGLVLRRYLTHHEDDEFRSILATIRRRTAATRFCAHAGLFDGRAGLALALADNAPSSIRRPAPEPQSDAGSVSSDSAALDQMRRLAWHAVGYRGRLAFPGDGSLRLSADLATGGAGVLLAVGAVLGVESARLPFLGPREPSPA